MKRHLVIGDGLSSWASELVDAAPRGQVAYLGADATCHLTYLRDTVIEEVAFGLEQRGIHPDIMLDQVTAILTDLNLMDLAEAHPTRLSGGQTRRVALASVLVLQADTLILDDPWAGLDTTSCKQVCDILDRYPGDIIAVAHSLPPIDHHFDCFELRDGTMVPYTGHHPPPQLPPCAPTGDIVNLGNVAGRREPPRRRWWQFTTPTEPGFATPSLHLRLERGEICWLRGPNGVGKSTLLHTLALTPQPASISLQTQRRQHAIIHPATRKATQPLCPTLLARNNQFGQATRLARWHVLLYGFTFGARSATRPATRHGRVRLSGVVLHCRTLKTVYRAWVDARNDTRFHTPQCLAVSQWAKFPPAHGLTLSPFRLPIPTHNPLNPT